jgi:hypothetical protein
MNLAEQVRQVHELKKPYELALKELSKPYSGFAMTCDDFDGYFKCFITQTKHDEVYFLGYDDYNDEFYRFDNLRHLSWFTFRCKNHSDAEKLAHQHGFKTEMVMLESFCGVTEIKALKISWGE